MANEYEIHIGGKPVSYLKRVRYGEPVVRFATDQQNPARYGERIAKGWRNTCRKFWDDVQMIPYGEN